MKYDSGTEAEAIGWIFDEEDIRREEREASGEYTEFEAMLNYYDMTEEEWARESGNSRANLWWNYRTFGKP